MTQIEILKSIEYSKDYSDKKIPKNIGSMITNRVIGKEKTHSWKLNP